MSESSKQTPLVFTGNGREYFGIWIVNLLLSIITLGIYSAWAKVRRKKYFYNNTLIDGVGFDYHAKPISILKGRIIAVIFFLAYSLSGLIHPFLPAVFGLIFLIALPWMIVRTMIFNARNTSHRGLRFNFVGKVGKAVATFIGLPLLAPFTLGLIIPYASHQKNQYLMNNHRFGMSPFTMQRVVKQFYLVYLKLLAILLLIVALIGMISAVAIPAYQDYIKRKTVVSQLASPTVHTTLTQKASPSAFIPTVNAATETYPSEQEMQAEYEAQMQQAMSQEAEKGRNKIEEMEKAAKFLPFIVPILLIYILIIFGFLGYLQARLGNLVWNNTTLDQLSFKSSLRARELVWLYFTNALAIMLTVGLATPWAAIRLAKYRTSRLKIVGDVDFDQFVGDKKAEVTATGEELADFFDVDLSFG